MPLAYASTCYVCHSGAMRPCHGRCLNARMVFVTHSFSPFVRASAPASLRPPTLRLQSNGGRGVCETGFWGYSRHPNFFGDLLQWWGIFTVCSTVFGPAADANEGDWGYATICGPLFLTVSSSPSRVAVLVQYVDLHSVFQSLFVSRSYDFVRPSDSGAVPPSLCRPLPPRAACPPSCRRLLPHGKMDPSNPGHYSVMEVVVVTLAGVAFSPCTRCSTAFRISDCCCLRLSLCSIHVVVNRGASNAFLSSPSCCLPAAFQPWNLAGSRSTEATIPSGTTGSGRPSLSPCRRVRT